MQTRAKLSALGLALTATSCAQLHHIQISDIDNTASAQTHFDIKASDTGVNVEEASTIARVASSSPAVREATNSVSSVWSLITYGPRTGNLTFSSDYANELVASLHGVCPSGKITSLTSVRESAHYPIISGEIVRFTGYCAATNAMTTRKN